MDGTGPMVTDAMTRAEVRVSRARPWSGYLPNPHDAWTATEDQVLRLHYSSSGPGALTNLLNRSKRAIIRRAGLLGLSCRGNAVMRPWSKEEVAAIEECASLEVALTLAGNPLERTRKAIREKWLRRAANTQPKRLWRPWSAEDDRVLEANYRTHDNATLAALLGRSKAAVANRLSERMLVRTS